MIFQNEQLIGIIPAHLVDKKVFSHLGLSYGGIVISKNLRTVVFLKILKSLLHYLRNEGVYFFVWKEIPNFYKLQFSDELKYFSYLLNANVLRRDFSSVINLNNSFRLSKSIKRDACLARRKGFVVKKMDEYESFWNNVLIPELNAIYQTKPVHSLNEIDKLAKLFPENIKLYCVLLEDEIVGGCVLFVNGKTVHTQYISGLRVYRKYGVLDLLFYEWIFKEFSSFNYFEFGTSHENEGKQINERLLFWKETFGARSCIQDYYEINVKNVHLLDDIMI